MESIRIFHHTNRYLTWENKQENHPFAPRKAAKSS